MFKKFNLYKSLKNIEKKQKLSKMFLQAICLVILQLIFMSSAQEIIMGLNDGKCAIKLISTKMTWANADKYCAARNSRLFTPFLLGHSFLHKHLFEDLGIHI